MLLNDWHIGSDDPYSSPEIKLWRISGYVYGHPDRDEGEFVTLSPPLESTGREIKTSSGNRYRLGNPSMAYAKWVVLHVEGFDPDNPFPKLPEIEE